MLKPKKSLGQNFLIDKNICRKIINISKINNSLVLEIGPGTGLLTDEILKKKIKKLILVEKDKDLFKFLLKKYKNNNKIEILNIDALNFNYEKYKKLTIISNLPYNISSKLIMNLLIKYKNINFMIFMIQKELANKFKYIENKKKNKFNLFIKYCSDYNIMFNISNNVFYPKPKVQSSIITIEPTNKNEDLKKIYNFLSKIFANKRKKIKNNIEIDIKHNKIIDNLLEIRAENLNFKDTIKLFKIF